MSPKQHSPVKYLNTIKCLFDLKKTYNNELPYSVRKIRTKVKQSEKEELTPSIK
jgi:hypothetical protein